MKFQPFEALECSIGLYITLAIRLVMEIRHLSTL